MSDLCGNENCEIYYEDSQQAIEALKAEVEKSNRQSAEVWAILNGLGLKMYSEDETIQMVNDRAEKAEAERDRLRELFSDANLQPYRSGGFLNHDYDMARISICMPINEARSTFKALNHKEGI